MRTNIKKIKYTPEQYANYIYQSHNGMNPMRLQKIMFYLYQLSLQRGEPIFDFDKADNEDKFQAWKYGPVIPKLYRAMKFTFMGLDELDPINCNLDISDQVKKDLRFLYNFSTTELRDLSQKNQAWIKARNNLASDGLCANLLEDDLIKKSSEIVGQIKK